MDIRKIFIIICIMLIPAGCTPAGNVVTASYKPDLKAIYLAPEDGALISADELKDCPEVVTVGDFSDLKNDFRQGVSIWIDKGAVSLADTDWLREEPQCYAPLVLIGVNNAVYSFRDCLPVSYIEGPYIDWSEYELEPGFCVWMLKDKSGGSDSFYMNQYDFNPSAEQLLALAGRLLAGEEPLL